MAYVPNPLNAAEPINGEQALSAAAEFRAIKGYIGKMPVVEVTGNKTFALSDAGSDQLHPASDTATRTWLVPDNSAVAFPIGTLITISVEHGAGSVLLGMAGTDTMRLVPTGATGTRTLPPNSVTNIKKITTTSWQCVTNGGS